MVPENKSLQNYTEGHSSNKTKNKDPIIRTYNKSQKTFIIMPSNDIFSS